MSGLFLASKTPAQSTKGCWETAVVHVHGHLDVRIGVLQKLHFGVVLSGLEFHLVGPERSSTRT
jgi:hypothetical protein